jgi:hypothetical protein
MNELEIFLLTRVLTQNSNTMELVKFIDKNRKYQIQIEVVALKVTSCRTMTKNQNWKKVKIQDPMGKINFFFSTLPFSPWVVLSTWLHEGVPQLYRKIEFTTHFEQKFTMGSYGVGIGRAWYCRKACEICNSLIKKKKLKKIK